MDEQLEAEKETNKNIPPEMEVYPANVWPRLSDEIIYKIFQWRLT